MNSVEVYAFLVLSGCLTSQKITNKFRQKYNYQVFKGNVKRPKEAEFESLDDTWKKF